MPKILLITFKLLYFNKHQTIDISLHHIWLKTLFNNFKGLITDSSVREIILTLEHFHPPKVV